MDVDVWMNILIIFNFRNFKKHKIISGTTSGSGSGTA